MIINKYTNKNKKISLSDFNSIIDVHNKLVRNSDELKYNKEEILPAEINISNSKTIIIKKFNWTRNGNDATILTDEIGIYNDGLDLEDKYLKLSFNGGDYTTTTEYPNYDGMVYIGAVLSNCSSTENNNNFSEILDGTVVQLSNPRVSPTKMHIVKLPISTYNNNNSQVNTSFFNDSMCVIGGVKVDNTGNICSIYQYHTGHINDYYKTHPFEAFVFNKNGIKINNGNITDNVTTIPYTPNNWNSADYNSFVTGTNYVYVYIFETDVLLYVSTIQNEYPECYLICTVEFDGTKITNIIQNQNQDILLTSNIQNEEAEYNKTIINRPEYDLMGTDTADTDTWTYGDVDGSDNPLGLRLYAICRINYDPVGEKQINIFTRKLTFSKDGLLNKIGEEIKYSIPTIPHSAI